MTLLTIFSRTPSWVWAMLAALLALGLSQVRTRRVPLLRLLILPLVLLGLGLWTLAPVFMALPLVGVLWLGALAGAAALALRRPPKAGAQWLPTERRLQLPGSWWPLVLIVAVFSLRYTMGVSLALHPAWRLDPAVQLPAALLFGAISGALLGGTLGLLRLARAGGHTIAARAR